MGRGDVELDRGTGLPVSSVDLLRRRIINVVGHELRTPTTTVRGLAEAAAAADGDEREALLAALVRASRRLEGLVEEVLLASSITTALPVGAAEEVDLVAVACEVWTGLGVDGDLDAQGAAVVRTQPEALRRALERVLANAASLGTAPFVASGSSTAGQGSLSVSSGGPVLRPDELALATEAFFRGEAAVTRAPGLGLGLAIARTLIEGGGGFLDLRGRDGGGVVATITLPVTP